MSTLETFLFGAVGGGIAFVALFVLPELRQSYERESGWPSSRRLYVGSAILAIYLLMAGLVSILIGDASQPKHAIFYGMGWEAVVKGAAAGGETIKDIYRRSSSGSSVR